MPGAFWLARISSLGKSSRGGASSSHLRLSHRSISGTPSEAFVGTSGRARDKDYLVLNDTRDLGGWDFGSVRTEIRGEGAAPRTVEEGVVHKTVDVYQSMRQERSAV